MSNNHVDIRSVWKSLVASCVCVCVCVCVAEVRMCIFNAFVSSTKVFISRTTDVFIFYVEVGLETPLKEKKQKLGKNLLQNLISSRDQRFIQDFEIWGKLHKLALTLGGALACPHSGGLGACPLSHPGNFGKIDALRSILRHSGGTSNHSAVANAQNILD